MLIAAVILGTSGGICINAGVASTVAQVPAALRGEVSSAYFAGLYVLLACPAIGVGLLAAHTGLISAGVAFCAFVIVLVLGIAAFEFRQGRTQPGGAAMASGPESGSESERSGAGPASTEPRRRS